MCDIPKQLHVTQMLLESFTKSYSKLEFLQFISNLIQDYQSKGNSVVRTLIKILKARDLITYGHGERVQCLVLEIAQAIGLESARFSDLGLFAEFHDLGKVGISDLILLKEGPLTEIEWHEMQKHSEIGSQITQSAPELLPIARWILCHHERWDGTGYPLGLKGQEIPLECRILALADSYDAMTNDRPYRKEMSQEQAIHEIRRCSGTQFDPELVESFIANLLKRVDTDSLLERLII